MFTVESLVLKLLYFHLNSIIYIGKYWNIVFHLKGKYQLATEIKEKEIEGLKETLKALQVK